MLQGSTCDITAPISGKSEASTYTESTFSEQPYSSADEVRDLTKADASGGGLVKLSANERTAYMYERVQGWSSFPF